MDDLPDEGLGWAGVGCLLISATAFIMSIFAVIGVLWRVIKWAFGL